MIEPKYTVIQWRNEGQEHASILRGLLCTRIQETPKVYPERRRFPLVEANARLLALLELLRRGGAHADVLAGVENALGHVPFLGLDLLEHLVRLAAAARLSVEPVTESCLELALTFETTQWGR